MIYVLLCILASSMMVVLFRLSKPRRIPLLPMITVNYYTCVICGFLWMPELLIHLKHLPAPAFSIGIFHGFLFISLFFLIGKASQEIGVAYTAMITRVSVVFPTLLSVIAFSEMLDGLSWMGVVCALCAIILLHIKYFKKSDETTDARKIILISTTLFLGTGLADSLFKIIDHFYSNIVEGSFYTTLLFFFAAFGGTLLSARQIILNKVTITSGTIIWGIILGIPNFFSIIFLLKALETLPGSVFFPINNVGVLVFTSLIGLLYFKEKFMVSTWAGIILACISIILIAHKFLWKFMD